MRETICLKASMHRGNHDQMIDQVFSTQINLHPADGILLRCEAAVEARVFVRLSSRKWGQQGKDGSKPTLLSLHSAKLCIQN